MQGGDPLAVPVHQHVPLLPKTRRLEKKETQYRPKKVKHSADNLQDSALSCTVLPVTQINCISVSQPRRHYSSREEEEEEEEGASRSFHLIRFDVVLGVTLPGSRILRSMHQCNGTASHNKM